MLPVNNPIKAARALNFILTDNSVPFSLSPFNSDYWGNLVIMEQVVGTLVKYTQDGVYEPFLIEKWETSEDEKTWTFEFRRGLTAENGEVIDANSFADSFRRMLKLYSKIYDPPTFSSLSGWKAFKDGNLESLGIQVLNRYSLKMIFEKRASGILEFLAMPYFGFYSKDDFDQNNNWKNLHKITSSAAYKVTSATDSSVELQSRPGWLTLKKFAPEIVKISSSNLEDALEKQQLPIIVSLKEGDEGAYEGFRKYFSTPTLLTSLILSPLMPPFDNKEIRVSFRTIVRKIFSEETKNLSIIQNSPYMYPNFRENLIKDLDVNEAIKLLKSKGPLRIKIFRQTLTNQNDLNVVTTLLDRISKTIEWTFEFDTPEKIGVDWQKNAFSNRFYPIRVARVDVGGSPENWVTDMMFCSNLGVSFPDSEGHICALVNDYAKSSEINMETYSRRLHESIEKESSVIPLLHSGLGWLVSEKVSIENISPTMSLPRFDHLEILE
jgi:ABC-type transport system substrate-binding protein